LALIESESMTEHCPACNNSLTEQASQRFCSNCGEPINADVDRNSVRRQASGFLSDSDRRMLLDTINGDRDHRSEYTITHVQEQARQALIDFRLIELWNPIENDNVLLLDNDLETDYGDEEGEELSLELMSSVSLMTILYATWGVHGTAMLIKDAIQSESNLENDAEVDIQFRINGEQRNMSLEEIKEKYG